MDAMIFDDDHAQRYAVSIKVTQRSCVDKHKNRHTRCRTRKVDDKTAALAAKDSYFSSVKLALDSDTLNRMRNADLDDHDQIELYGRLGVEKNLLESRPGTTIDYLELAMRLSAR